MALKFRNMQISGNTIPVARQPLEGQVLLTVEELSHTQTHHNR